VTDADRAWKASYRTAREAGDGAAMAWALWSGGTLARQRGAFPLAWRLLGLAKSQARLGRDRAETASELADLARELERIGLRHAREMVARAQQEFGVAAEAVR